MWKDCLLVMSVKIQQDPNNLTKTGTIVTPVDFGHLKDVFVITTNKQDAIDKSEDASNEKIGLYYLLTIYCLVFSFSAQ